jgi:hypothetical protein
MLGCQLNCQYRIPLLSSLCNMIYIQLRYYKRPRLQQQKHKFVADVRHAFSSSLFVSVAVDEASCDHATMRMKTHVVPPQQIYVSVAVDEASCNHATTKPKFVAEVRHPFSSSLLRDCLLCCYFIYY